MNTKTYRVTVEFEFTKIGFRDTIVKAQSAEHARELAELSPWAYDWSDARFPGEGSVNDERIIEVTEEEGE